jgi:hypothetical protein
MTHPMFISIKFYGNRNTVVNDSIPDIENYSLVKPSPCDIQSYDIERAMAVLCKWSKRRSINIHFPHAGIAEHKHKLVYLVDVIGYRNIDLTSMKPNETLNNNRNYMISSKNKKVGEEIVFIVLFFSKQRYNKMQQLTMTKYCKKIQTLTEKQFRFSPRVYLVNINAKYQIHSVCIDP